jgi:uncharacterized protein YndB with AHSA1/START domain
VVKWFLRIGASLLVLALVAVTGLWFASNRSDSGRMRGSIEIARPPEEIWPWMTEPDRLTQWVGWLTVVEPDSATPPAGIGHRETWVLDDPRMKRRVRVPGTITLWEPPLQMGVHVELPGMGDGDVFYKLTDLGNGRTRLEQDGRFRYVGRFVKLMEPMITPEAMRKMLADMNRLREKIEAQPYQPESSLEPEGAAAEADSAGAGR